MSPFRSIAGPATVRMPTPSSLRTMYAGEVLPSPGGPARRTWSSASPRALAASSAIESCSLTRSWPTKSLSVRGRSERSSSSSASASTGARNWLICYRLRRAYGSCGRPQRVTHLLLDRQVGVDIREHALRVDERPAELDERVSCGQVAGVRAADVGADELRLQLEHDSLRGLETDAGDR